MYRSPHGIRYAWLLYYRSLKYVVRGYDVYKLAQSMDIFVLDRRVQQVVIK